jgi:hypothetical protein
MALCWPATPSEVKFAADSLLEIVPTTTGRGWDAGSPAQLQILPDGEPV